MVTVITATRNLIEANRIEMLRRCVRSVAAVSVPHEHIIIDGASTDGTIELLSEMTKECSGLSFISAPDLGIYDAYNSGVKAAKGEWIYFIGSDDYIHSADVFDDVVCGLSADDGILISPVRFSDGTEQEADNRLFRHILTIKHYCHQGVLMRKSVIERMGMFDTHYKICGDFLLCLNAHLSNVHCRIVPKNYTEFSLGGISGIESGLERAERLRVARDVFSLTDSEAGLLSKKNVLPIRVVIPLVFHGNTIIRVAARHALKRIIANLIGLFDERGALRVAIPGV